jgi:hypothetical protein
MKPLPTSSQAHARVFTDWLSGEKYEGYSPIMTRGWKKLALFLLIGKSSHLLFQRPPILSPTFYSQF